MPAERPNASRLLQHPFLAQVASVKHSHAAPFSNLATSGLPQKVTFGSQALSPEVRFVFCLRPYSSSPDVLQCSLFLKTLAARTPQNTARSSKWDEKARR